MKIGFDVSQTGAGRTGCGWYARSLIEHLEHCDSDNSYTLYPTFGDSYWSTNGGSDTYQSARPNFERGLRHRTLESMQSFWRDPPPRWESDLGNPDLIHANNYYCPVGLETAKLVYTLYDLSFLEHPDWSTEANRVSCFEGVFNASLYADSVIAISEYSRRTFLETFPYFPKDRITIVSPASRFESSPTPKRTSSLANLRTDSFWLHVGTDEPRKNLDHLLRAYATVRTESRSSIPLVLSGADGWTVGNLEHRIDRLGLSEDVIRLGYVDEGDLEWLYTNCFGFVFPSLYEGFGMPVLEAMALGAPVVASRTTSIPEITGSAALLIDPLDHNSTAAAMQRLVDEPAERDSLRRASIEQSSKFSWEDSARRVREAYVDIAGRPKRLHER